jgi:hypothetical protein
MADKCRDIFVPRLRETGLRPSGFPLVLHVIRAFVPPCLSKSICVQWYGPRHSIRVAKRECPRQSPQKRGSVDCNLKNSNGVNRDENWMTFLIVLSREHRPTSTVNNYSQSDGLYPIQRDSGRFAPKTVRNQTARRDQFPYCSKQPKRSISLLFNEPGVLNNLGAWMAAKRV